MNLFWSLTRPFYVCRVFSEPQEPVQRELTALDQELEKQTVQLREWQMQELLKLRQELHLLERERQHKHQHEVTTHTHAPPTSRARSAGERPDLCTLKRAQGDIRDDAGFLP